MKKLIFIIMTIVAFATNSSYAFIYSVSLSGPGYQYNDGLYIGGSLGGEVGVPVGGAYINLSATAAEPADKPYVSAGVFAYTYYPTWIGTYFSYSIDGTGYGRCDFTLGLYAYTTVTLWVFSDRNGTSAYASGELI